jgi:two-component system, NtrC family, sensor kinase
MQYAYKANRLSCILQCLVLSYSLQVCQKAGSFHSFSDLENRETSGMFPIFKERPHFCYCARHAGMDAGRVIYRSNKTEKGFTGTPMLETQHANGSAVKTMQSNSTQDALKVQQALMERPSITIRMRIISCFVLLSVLMCGSALSMLFFASQFEAKVLFLEKLTEYAFEVQQARRFEKNFFLYGTNLQDALDNVQAAKDHLSRNSNDVKRIAGEKTLHAMEGNLAEYQRTLEKFLQTRGGQSLETGPAVQETELQLRKYGAKVISDIEDLIHQERTALNEMIHSSTLITIGFLVLMFSAMVLVAFMLIQAVLAPLRRMEHYLDRIAAGDNSLIVPARKYRDEFSRLALALNKMLQELDLRQQQLIQSAKMAAIGSLTSGIAHELNNPLNNIGLITETLIENYADHDDKQKLRLLDQINTQMEGASATVRNLLDFTRKDKPAFAAVSIPVLIHETLKLLSNEMNLARVELRSEIDDPVPTVMGSPRNIQQVFLNLMLNAIQAMPGGGELLVKVRVESDFLRIDIRDTGTGIPADNLAKVFDPFFTTKEPGIGTGLGLAVSYGIMEAHGGKITVESEIGKGTVFSTFFPLKIENK